MDLLIGAFISQSSPNNRSKLVNNPSKLVHNSTTTLLQLSTGDAQVGIGWHTLAQTALANNRK